MFFKKNNANTQRVVGFVRKWGFGGIFAIYCKNHDKTGGKL
ncbi:MAG: hypothetical protein RBR32_03005 [Bacteroidales bacterium]|jgi:hypothetical protein|nr:hypothetical protein [Bacteroidales bacterium]